MYRIVALLALVLAAGCGGGGGSEEPTETAVPSSTQPTSDVAGARTQTPATPEASPTPPGTYEVVAGDTLWDLAERFDTTVEALVELNALASADDLTVGQVLKISGAGPSPTAASTVSQ